MVKLNSIHVLFSEMILFRLSLLMAAQTLLVSHEYPAIEDKAPMSRFVVKDIPPMGYRTYIASNEKVEIPEMNIDLNSGVIESPFFKATLDAKRGRIISLVDKRRGKEMVDANAPQGFGQYFYERFGYKQIYDWIARSLYPQYNAHKMIFAAYDMPQDVAYSSALPEDMTLTLEKSAIDVKAVMTGTYPWSRTTSGDYNLTDSFRFNAYSRPRSKLAETT